MGSPPSHRRGLEAPRTVADVFAFWRPLAATMLLMAVEGPVVLSVIARLPDPSVHLAVYGVSIALIILLESPILRILSVSISVVRDRESFLVFRRFALGNSVLMSGLALLLLLPPVFNLLTQRVLVLAPELQAPLWEALAVFVPSPVLVGYRRLYQGILIAAGRPRAVAMSTVVRFTTLSVSAMCVLPYVTTSGAMVGAASHIVGLVCEAAVSRYWAEAEVRRLLAGPERPGPAGPLRAKSAAALYYPLALSTVLSQLIAPLQAFFVVRGTLPVESLAVTPVVQGVLNPFTWSAYAIQDATLALVRLGDDARRLIVQFGFRLAGIFTGFFALFAVTPLGGLWFAHVNALPENLVGIASVAVLFLLPLPAVCVWRSYQRGLLIEQRKGSIVLFCDCVDLVTNIALLALFTFAVPLVGAYAVMAAFSVGYTVNAVFLHLLAFRSSYYERSPDGSGAGR